MSYIGPVGLHDGVGDLAPLAPGCGVSFLADIGQFTARPDRHLTDVGPAKERVGIASGLDKLMRGASGCLIECMHSRTETWGPAACTLPAIKQTFRRESQSLVWYFHDEPGHGVMD